MFRNISKKVGFTFSRGEENRQNFMVWQLWKLGILFFKGLDQGVNQNEVATPMSNSAAFKF
jgi:hypothetical protein